MEGKRKSATAVDIKAPKVWYRFKKLEKDWFSRSQYRSEFVVLPEQTKGQFSEGR